MTRKALLEELAFLLDVPENTLDEKTKFRELDNYNSLVAIGIVSMLEEKVGTKLDIWQLRNLKNVGELMDLVGREKFEE
jgi:acyl carrier protein